MQTFPKWDITGFLVRHEAAIAWETNQHFLKQRVSLSLLSSLQTSRKERSVWFYLTVGCEGPVVLPTDRFHPFSGTQVGKFAGTLTFNAPLPWRAKHQATRRSSQPGEHQLPVSNLRLLANISHLAVLTLKHYMNISPANAKHYNNMVFSKS